MNKLNLLAITAGIAMAFTTIGAEAAFVKRPSNNYPEAVVEHNCADQMGHMRSVHRADIDTIDGQSVFLIHVCEDLTVVGRNNYGALFVNGNVNRLRLPIAHNSTLISALNQQGLDQNDVVSLRFGGNGSIVLYVYDRDMN